MFSHHLNQDEEPLNKNGFPLTDLSLSSGVQRAQKEQNNYLPYVLQGNLFKYKRQRSLDGAALTIGTGSSSSTILVSTAPSGGAYGGETNARNNPNLPGVNNIIPSLCHKKMSGFGGAGLVGSGSEANTSRYHQPVILYGRFSCENGKKMSGYDSGRNGAAYRHSSASEKIRHRMIKNRESAARSRARKQALEAQQQLENTELKKENDLLKRIVRFLLAIVRTKRMKLPTLSRSFSAPF